MNYQRFKRIRDNVISLLKDRQCVLYVPALNNQNTLMTLFSNENEEALDIFANNDKSKYMVRFSFSEDMGVRTAREIVNTFEQQNNNTNYILVCVRCSKVSHYAKSCFVNSDLHIEYFLHSELIYNPTKHIYVPKHKLMSKVEANEVLSKYNINYIPIILKDDVICRWYGGKVGDVFEIDRAHPNGNTIHMYRVVVARSTK